jgi:hypothetical protein
MSNSITYTFKATLHDVVRSFDTRITSTREGYSARVIEQPLGGGTRPVALHRPFAPRDEIGASYFYAMRLHCRGVFVADVEEATRTGRFDLLDDNASETELVSSDCYRRANLIGWPDGYPEATDDDLSDWRLVLERELKR